MMPPIFIFYPANFLFIRLIHLCECQLEAKGKKLFMTHLKEILFFCCVLRLTTDQKIQFCITRKKCSKYVNFLLLKGEKLDNKKNVVSHLVVYFMTLCSAHEMEIER